MPHDMFRILMNQLPNDGGGAPAGAPPAPGAAPTTQGQAQGQPAAITPEQLKGMFDEFKNSTFAEVRRTVESMVGKKKGGQQPADSPSDPPPGAPPADDVRALMGRYRAFERAAAPFKMSAGALARMERAFEAEKPEDVTDWVKQYATDFGLGQQDAGAPPAAQNPTAHQPPPLPPQGSQPPNPTPHAPNPVPLGDLDRANLHPNKLTADMVQRLGPDGTLKYVKEYFAKNGRR